MDGSAHALLIAQNFAGFWLAWRLSKRLLPRVPCAERILSALVLFAGLVQIILIGCGTCGQLTRWGVGSLLALLVLAEAGYSRWKPGQPQPTQPLEQQAGDHGLWNLLGQFLFGLAIIMGLWPAITSGTLFGWDILSYHAVAPAWWLQSGSLDLHPFNFQAYYPLAAELQSLWFMLPHGIDTHANLACVLWVGILISAWAVLMTRLRQRTWLGALALCACLSSPQVAGRLPFFTSSDLAMGSLLFAMHALCWRGTSADENDSRARLFLSGLAGGLAVGIKITAAPHLVIAGLYWSRGGLGGPIQSRALRFTSGALLGGGFWYVRNAVLTGNPFFPAALGPFDGPFDAAAQHGTSLVGLIEKGLPAGQDWLHVWSQFINWPAHLGYLALGGLAIGALRVIRCPQGSVKAHHAMLLASALVFLALFPWQPFSAAANRPAAPPLYLARYLTFPFMVGLALVPSAWTAVHGSPPLHPMGRGGFHRGLRGPQLAVALISLLVLCVWRTEEKTLASTRSLHSVSRPLSAGWKAIESLPPGTRLAAQSFDPPSHTLVYPLFGRRYQLRPTAIDSSGASQSLLHDSWRSHPQNWWWEFTDPVRAGINRSLKNMRACGLDTLVLQRHPWLGNKNNTLSLRRAVLKLTFEKRVYTDPITEIWDISQPTPPR